ncbi:hypothetical protein HPP92_010526 [Vanilla planifolia]|uniref:Uncharacterized protein n=1 Tax=Vanilla planifolia TaxID=51239 RepID=A0A835RAL4_VANPL|nr:hypothetical protein HPP92_010526 [Vanilla planifolia]
MGCVNCGRQDLIFYGEDCIALPTWRYQMADGSLSRFQGAIRKCFLVYKALTCSANE